MFRNNHKRFQCPEGRSAVHDSWGLTMNSHENLFQCPEGRSAVHDLEAILLLGEILGFSAPKGVLPCTTSTRKARVG
jgi:hypothetical protein